MRLVSHSLPFLLLLAALLPLAPADAASPGGVYLTPCDYGEVGYGPACYAPPQYEACDYGYVGYGPVCVYP
jgi:hypothetical protein